MTVNRWQFWIDVGGTFTDCIGRSPSGDLHRAKVLSSGVTKGTIDEGSTSRAIVDSRRPWNPPGFWNGYECRILDGQGRIVAASRVESSDADRGVFHLEEPLSIVPVSGSSYELASPEEAPLLAIRQLLKLRLDEPIPPVSVRLGTTRGTNALLTRTGARTAFVTTRGFGDILRIGYQNRPRLFDLAIHKRRDLFEQSVEIDERVTPKGEVLVPLDDSQVRQVLGELRAAGVESLAICLLNAYLFDGHEHRVREMAREMGFREISVSHEVAPMIKIVSRGDTTTLDAYLNPVLRTYVSRLRDALGTSDLRLLTSAGGLKNAADFSGKDSILSGPAGGVVGFSRVASAAGFERAIGFDMGGTSTDVSRFDGRFEYEFETEKAGVRVVAPMMAIETVAAGGGSICRFDGVKLGVGPESAGADPGPACYGRGGPLAVTDLNLFLGRIQPDWFPFPLHVETVEERLAAIRDEIQTRAGTAYTLTELADGFLRVANANMARAIRAISVAKGYDPRDYTLVPFGGAAAQHACAVARELGMTQILCHPDASLLSAYGVGLADVTRHRALGLYRPYSEEAVQELDKVFSQLIDEASRELQQEGIPRDRIRARRHLDLRYRGLDAFLTIPQPEEGTYRDAYEKEHERLYGYARPDRPVEIVAARIEVIGQAAQRVDKSARRSQNRIRADQFVTACFEGRQEQAAVFLRDDLAPGDTLPGPALIREPHSTTVVDPGWMAEVLSGGELLITDHGLPRRASISTDSDPIELEVFSNHFQAIAEQMGLTLRNTATSVNVKERLDFSCAIFTGCGELVVNAPHIPVHLGAMGETVRCALEDNPSIRPGDVFVTNDPYRGGSHLPDVTVITPVFDDAGERLQFITASRAHHAEIGGIMPGSMPPFSHNLAEEGVLIQNFKLFDAGRERFDELEKLLHGGPHPSRAVADNLADIAAQVAANRQGAADLQRLMRAYTVPTVIAYMGHIQQAAETKMRDALRRLGDGDYRFEDHLDDGAPIRVLITIRGDAATIDFTGTGPVSAGNLNANRAIVTAAVMYCFRCLIGEDIPLNQGMLRPLTIVIPPGLLSPPRSDDPRECPAVAGGNVETSQRVVDVVLGALGAAAASQGTMNNLLFGNERFGYYETICGGAGATENCPGADAIQTHMTNTRLTDPEMLELRYPARVVEFSIRRDSGGSGRYPGGNGVKRVIEFLDGLEVSLLTQRRGPYQPFGLHGGGPGGLGRNTLIHADGRQEVLPGACHFQVQRGDRLCVETPGGGGYQAVPTDEERVESK